MENFETIREALSHWHLPGTSYDPKKKTIRKKLFYNEEAESLSRRSNHFEICSIGDLFDERRFPGFLNYSLSSFPSTSFSGRAGLAPKIIVNANTNNANSPEEAEQSDEITKNY